jgi:hypothetical protein
MNIRIFLQMVFFSLLFSSPSEARLAQRHESPSEYINTRITININKDGTYTRTEEVNIDIKNETAREMYGSKTFYFTKDASEIKILEAKCINGDKIDVINEKDIEIKPLASSEQGFDQTYQTLVSFPNLVVGSKIYLKTEEKILKPVVKNHVCLDIFLGYSAYEEGARIEINSEIKNLQLKVNDPDNSLSITRENSETYEKIIITQNKAMFYHLVNEKYTVTEFMPKLTYISISSFKNLHEVGKSFAFEYERVINQDIPEKLRYIVEKAKKQENDFDKIDYVISEINQQIRYMGSWQTIEGKFFPRNLEEISKSGYADCKEYSALTSAMLNHLGINARVAFVRRSEQYVNTEESPLPSYSFNHAIVNAEVQGKEIWLDPTNFISMSRGIFSDIAGRYALIVDSKLSEHKFIPYINSSNNRYENHITIEIDDNKITKHFDIKLFGEAAAVLTGLGLKFSDEQIKEHILQYLSNENQILDKEINLPNLNSRIVKDIAYTAKITIPNDMVDTNLGQGIILEEISETPLKILISDLSTYEGVVYLEEPFSRKKTTVLKNFKADNINSLDYNIDSKWLKLSRKLSKHGKDIHIEEFIELKKNHLLPSEYNSAEIKDLSKKLIDYAQSSVLIRNETKSFMEALGL